MKFFAAFLLTISLAASLRADVVQMKSGNRIDCVVLQEGSDAVMIRRGYGTMTLPRSAIASIEKTPTINTAAVTPTTKPTPGQRIPAWSDVLNTLLKQKWATNIQQIPATVIDTGVLQNVPYQSYRCGEDYEVNIYGDLDHPAGIEIGVYRTLLDRDDVKRNCIAFIASVMTDKTDADLVRSVNRTKDKIARGEISVEVTPATDPDAYGGWWVSVYNQTALDNAKASPAELNQITVARDNPVTPPASPQPVQPKPTATPAPAAVASPVASAAPDSWTPSDISYARPSSTSGGGRVYVRGYTRRDGTYVQPHTRSSPRR